MEEQEKTVGKQEENRKVTEIFERLPELERNRVLYWLMGLEFAVENAERQTA